MKKLDSKIVQFAEHVGGGNLAHQLDAAPAPASEPACPTCQDLGVISYNVPVGHEWFGKLYPCPSCDLGRAKLVTQWNNRLVNARIPNQYRLCTFESWNQVMTAEHQQGKRLAYEACWLFAEQPEQNVSLEQAWRRAGKELGGDIERRSLVLHGPVGTGKTGLVAAAVNALLEKGRSVLWTRAQDLIASVQATYARDYDDHDGGEQKKRTETVKTMYKQAPILIVDEFQLVQRTPDRQEIMEGIIRYRHDYQLPTLITCNFGKDDLESQWGERTISVLLAMAHWIPVGGIPVRNSWQMPDGMEPF